MVLWSDFQQTFQPTSFFAEKVKQISPVKDCGKTVKTAITSNRTSSRPPAGFSVISLRDKQTIVFGSIFLECQGPCVGHEGSAASMSGCWSRNVFRNIRSHTEDYHSRGPIDRKERKHDQGSAVSNWFSWLCVCSRAAAPIEQNSGRLFHPVCSACRETTSPLNHCLVPEFWSWHFRKKKKRKKKRQK